MLRQDNVHLPAPGTRPAVGRWRVREMMNRELRPLPLDSSVASAWERAQELGGGCFPVMDDGVLAGLVTREALEKALAAGDRERPLADLPLWRDSIHVHPDHPLEVAMERLSQTPGLLPVVSRSDVRHLEGVITLEDILRALHYSRRL